MAQLNFEHEERKEIHSILILFVLVGLIFVTLFRYIGSENDLHQKIINESSIVTSNIAASIVFQDTDEIQRIHGSLKFSDEIILSCLYNKHGEVISTIGIPNQNLSIHCGSMHQENPLIYTYISEINYKNNLIGKLEVHVSRLEIFIDTIIFLAGTCLIALIIWLINLFAIRRLNVKLQSYESRLQQLIARRDGIIEIEHRKIAIEIHDQIGQLLSSANLNIRYLKQAENQPQSEQLLLDTENILNQVYARIKNISSELHPAILDFGVQAAIEWLAETRLSPNNIEWSIKRNRELKSLDPQLGIVIFKITQEAFTNILRHSHASMVTIQLNSNDEFVKMTIKDNGIGMGKQSVKKKFSLGLIGISERARSVGGSVVVSSNNSGTTLDVTIPIQDTNDERTN